MAIKGLSIPVFGEYRYNGVAASYVNGFVAGAAIEWGAEIETSDDNPLRGDNRIIEHDYGKFNSGTLTLNTSDLDKYTSKRLLNLKEVQKSIGEMKVTELIHDDDMEAKALGFGIIETHQINDVDTFRAVILTKVTPRIPAEAATTRGETIEWQTKEVECTIERSDEESKDYRHPWMREAWFDTETEAKEYLKTVLNVLETVPAISEAGTTAGKTKVTIINTTAGSIYKYSTTGPMPTYKQDLTPWTELESGEEIEAENGSALYVATVDESDKAIGCSVITVKAKE